MQLKKTVKISIYFIVCILVIVAGVYAFIQLKSKKESYNVDLFSLIPADATLIIGINDPQRLREQNTDFSFLLPDSNTFKLSTLFTTELLLSYHPNGSLLFTKLEEDAYKYLTDNLFKNKFSLFSKQEHYNGVNITIVPDQNEAFFCYSYHKGAFIGSHNKKLIERAIDLYTKADNVRTDLSLSTHIDKSNNKVSANLFVQKSRISLPFIKLLTENWIACQVETEGGDLLINGTLSTDLESQLVGKIISQSTGKGESLSENRIPLHIKSFVQLNIDSLTLQTIVTDSLFRNAIKEEMGVCTFLRSDTIPSDNPIADLSNKYRTEAAVIYGETNDKFHLFLQLQKNNGISTFSLALRKSATNF